MSLLGSVGKAVGKVTNGFFDPIGEAINGITGVNSQMDKSYAQQMASMNAQNEYNMRMWNLQNEYNSPVSQFARMKEAGIDINPIAYALGSGNLSNTASSVSSAGGFAGSGSPAGNPVSMLMGVASGLQGLKESKARTGFTEVQTRNAEQQGKNLEAVNEHTKLENDIMRHNLGVAQDTGVPVGSMPGLEQSVVKQGNRLWNWITDLF